MQLKYFVEIVTLGCINLLNLKVFLKPKRLMLKEINKEICELDYYECEACGGHLGIDATYLLQVGSVDGVCPYCGESYEIKEYE